MTQTGKRGGPIIPIAGTLAALMFFALPVFGKDPGALEEGPTEACQRGQSVACAETLTAAPALASAPEARDPTALVPRMRTAHVSAEPPTVLASIAQQDHLRTWASDTPQETPPPETGAAVSTRASIETQAYSGETARPDTGPADASAVWTAQAGATLSARPTATILAAIALLSAALAVSGGRLIGRHARRAVREPCAIPAVMKLRHEAARTVVRDISRLGARLDVTAGLKRNARIRLELPEIELTCRVIRVDETGVGLAFRWPLGKARFLRLMQEHRWKAGQGHP